MTTLSTETQQQMAISFEHADTLWKLAAARIVFELASRNDYLTSLNVVEELERQGYETHDLRAVGPVMNKAAKEGTIKHHAFIRRNDKHNRGTTVQWKSLIYGKVGR